MKHKHCELIKAWADGAEIELLSSKDEDGKEKWYPIVKPTWNDKSYYRIKPKILKRRYRLLLYWDNMYNKESFHTYTCESELSAIRWETEDERFIKWLGDWQEVVLEV